LANGASSGDFPPNTQQQEVHAMFKSQLANLRKQLDETVSHDLEILIACCAIEIFPT